MRRLIAAGIDFMICYVLNIIVYCTVISIWKMLRVVMGMDMEKHPQLLAISLFFILYILINIIYASFFDSKFDSNTLGKKIIGYKIYAVDGGKNKDWIVKHALSRTIASVLYAITALYYIGTYRMPYDKICGINSEIDSGVKRRFL